MSKSFAIRELKPIISIRGCHYSIVDPSWSYHLHEHSGYELLHCQQGKLIEWIHGESIELEAGAWMLIGPGIKHSTINESKSIIAYFSMHFDLEDIEIRNQLRDINFVHLREPDPHLQSLFLNLQQQINLSTSPDIKVPPDYTAIQKLGFQSILYQILFQIMEHIAAPTNAIQLHRKLLKVQEIELAQAIERKLNASAQTPAAISDIAKELFISRSHCNEAFKKVYGIAPKPYLSMMKLKKAKELLLQTNLTIEEISEQLQFSSISSFSRQFRRWTKHSPLQFKKQE